MNPTEKAERQRQADEGRQRILDALELPALTGTEKQITWAEGLRRERIENALTAHVHIKKGITYRLRTPLDDYLGVNYLDLPFVFTDEHEALQALRTAATCGQRTTAAWWINNRDTYAPMG